VARQGRKILGDGASRPRAIIAKRRKKEDGKPPRNGDKKRYGRLKEVVESRYLPR